MWEIDDKDNLTFSVRNPNSSASLPYFPLTNRQGLLFSAISPWLSGHIVSSNEAFITPPASIEDLKNPYNTKHIWLKFNNQIFNLSPLINSKNSTAVQAGLLWHKLSIGNPNYPVSAEIFSFIPENLPLETTIIKIKNISKNTIKITPYIGIPLFCRPAENLRDHRHVTSLLNRVFLKEYGIMVKPTMRFDEKGHFPNTKTYFVLSYLNNQQKPEKFYPTLESFTGAGSLIHPQALLDNKLGYNLKNKIPQGKEAFGGIKFKKQMLKPRQSISIHLFIGAKENFSYHNIINEILPGAKISKLFRESKESWELYSKNLSVDTGDKSFDFWIKWVHIQPALRKLFGCSFLPHFDYGKGGRGWRDLWQDLLCLLIFSPKETRKQLINNFKGVRIDGSNATIITSKNGFISDRNNISRVWSDHGVWPYLTLRLYIDQTADFNILFREIPYFQDHLIKRSRETTDKYPAGLQLKDIRGKIYKSTVLEHILVQNLIQFFNVGKHNNTRLENADWNDGLDMAYEKGETAAFSCMYAYNLGNLAQLLLNIKKRTGIKKIKILEEIVDVLLDTLTAPINYNNPNEKNKLLNQYFDKVKYRVSGRKISIPIEKIASDLRKKSRWWAGHIRNTEWLENPGIFNGYYDNSGKRVEGIKNNNSLYLTLTGQTFPIMSRIASLGQTKMIISNVNKHLKFKNFSYRLNTDFKHSGLNFGRAFAFAYGDKENGSVFCHMNVMFANALYKQGFALQGFKVLYSLFQNSLNANTYPQIPEYFNLKGEGLYLYLTGSASWYILTLITESFGIKKHLGDIIIEPKLSSQQFHRKSSLNIKITMDKKIMDICYNNPLKKSYPHYKIDNITINGKPYPELISQDKITIPKEKTNAILAREENKIEIDLI